MQRKILIVDDSETNIVVLKKILCDEYDILEAHNGEEAIKLMEKEYKELSLVLLDLMMPIMDGFEVLETVKEDVNLCRIPIIVTTGSGNEGTEIRALSCGAKDYIAKPYSVSVVQHRVRNTIQLRETATAVNMTKFDSLTGIYNKDYFYQEAEKILESSNVPYDIVCCDIERFRMINDMFCEHIGDKLLIYIATTLRESLDEIYILGRIGIDKFACLVEHKENYDNFDFEHALKKLNEFPIAVNILVKTGVYVIEDTSLAVSIMCDRAMAACNSIKGKYGVNYAYYDEVFHEQIKREQFIINSMYKGIEDNQFEVYYQPKIDILSEEVVGAEALVRWIHPEKGFMSPGEFIPLFEKNGFITILDMYVWERTCNDVSNWIKAGNKPIAVSVNVSRTDIYNPELTHVLLGLLEKYQLGPEIIHLEITESAYTESSQQLIKVVKKLKELGFIIEMDDFGTGYSSLNMLSDLPINIVKLDMSFVREIQNKKKQSIVRTIMFLAKQLEYPVVAEGVESEEQLKLLRDMGCEYVQGYYYSKPLPKPEFEKWLFEKMAK